MKTLRDHTQIEHFPHQRPNQNNKTKMCECHRRHRKSSLPSGSISASSSNSDLGSKSQNLLISGDIDFVKKTKSNKIPDNENHIKNGGNKEKIGINGNTVKNNRNSCHNISSNRTILGTSNSSAGKSINNNNNSNSNGNLNGTRYRNYKGSPKWKLEAKVC